VHQSLRQKRPFTLRIGVQPGEVAIVGIALLLASTFFSAIVGLACVFAVLKLSFGV